MKSDGPKTAVTIDLNDDLHEQLNGAAAQAGCTMSEFVEEALREMLSRLTIDAKPRMPTKLITVTGNGLKPGIDLNDNAALLDFMDKADGVYEQYRETRTVDET